VSVARDRGLWIAAGIAERAGDRLYNSAVLIGPGGLKGVYRKAHLWFEEALWFEPGDTGFPVWDTPFGRIGMAICYDCWFPEVFRTLALQGADIVALPTNWTTWDAQAANREAMANILVTAAAHANGLVIAAADRIGTERGQGFIGRSLIAGHQGWPIAGPASAMAEEIIAADVDLAEVRRARQWNAFNHPLRDRRADLYRLE
jgi:predicted amidohydrolase